MENNGKYKFNQFRVKLTQTSFTDFFEYYFSRLTQFAFAIVKSQMLAEETVLDVFLKIWEHKGNLSSIENIETYLFVSVRNTAMNIIRKEQKFNFDMFQDSHVQLAEYKPTAESLIIEHEMFNALNQAVAILPAKCKIIFKLIREDGLNRSEVAKILNISVKTVDNQVAIAVKKIAEQLHIDLTNPKNSQGLFTVLLTL